MRRTWVALALGLGAMQAAAAGWVVTSITVGGSPVESAQVNLRSAPDAALQTRTLQLKDELFDGTEIAAPADVELVLLSPGRMSIRKAAGDPGRLALLSGGPGGDIVEVQRGRFSFWRTMGQLLNPFTSRTGPAEARTNGTEFTVAVDPGEKIVRYRVQQGSILVTQRVQAQVGGMAALEWSQRRTLTAADGELPVPLTPADWLRTYGTYDEALTAFEAQVLAADTRQDVDAGVDALIALGDLLVLAGRPQDALAPYARARTLVQPPDVAYWQAVLLGRSGSALHAQHRYGEAAQAFRDSLALHETVPQRPGEYTVEEESTNIAVNLVAAGTWKCADSWADRLLSRLDAIGAGPARNIRSPLWAVRGDAALGLGRGSDALRWHQRVEETERTLAGIAGKKVSTRLVAATIALGYDETALARPTQAERRHRDALAMADRLFTGPHPLKADSYLGLAYAQRARGARSAALAELKRAFAVLDALPPDAVRRGDALALRGDLLAAAGRAADAVAVYRDARRLFAGVWPDESHPRFQALLPSLARALRGAGAPAAEAKEAESAARSGAQALQAHEAACPR